MDSQVNRDAFWGLLVATVLFGLVYVWDRFGADVALDWGWKILVLVLLLDIRGRLKRD